MAALEAFMLAEYNMQEYDSMLRQMADSQAANLAEDDDDDEEEDLRKPTSRGTALTLQSTQRPSRPQGLIPQRPSAEESRASHSSNSFHKSTSIRFDKTRSGKLTRRASNVFEIQRKSAGIEGFNFFSFRSLRYLISSIDQALPILSPKTPVRRLWDIFLLCFVLYNAIQVPFELAFGWPRTLAMASVDYAINILFAIDIVMTFRTSYLDHQGNLVRDGRKIAAQYLGLWFWIDLFASIPFDLVGTWLGLSSSNLTFMAFLKTPRLLRLGRLMRYIERLKNANVFRVFRLIAMMCLFAHWLACAWYMLYNMSRSLEWTFSPLEHESVLTKYTSAFYFAFLLLIGENLTPLNNIERVYFIITLVLGAAFYASVVGNMALLVSNLNATKARHKHKKDMVQDTMRYLGIPVHLQDRVQAYFDYITTYNHPGPEGMQFLNELPRCLHEDVSLWMHQDNLRQIPLFSECEHAFLMQLATRLRLAVFLAGEVIFEEGDVGHEMYVIKKGTVAVTNYHGELVAMLHEGMSFGELGILSTARRTATCIACSPCDLGLLSMMDLQLLMKDFKESALTIRDKARARLLELEARGTVVLNEHDAIAMEPLPLPTAPRPRPHAPAWQEHAEPASRNGEHPGDGPGQDGQQASSGDLGPGGGARHSTEATTGDGTTSSQLPAAAAAATAAAAVGASSAPVVSAGQLEDAMSNIATLLGNLSQQVESFESRVGKINTRVAAMETDQPSSTSAPTASSSSSSFATKPAATASPEAISSSQARQVRQEHPQHRAADLPPEARDFQNALQGTMRRPVHPSTSYSERTAPKTNTSHGRLDSLRQRNPGLGGAGAQEMVTGRSAGNLTKEIDFDI